MVFILQNVGYKKSQVLKTEGFTTLPQTPKLCMHRYAVAADLRRPDAKPAHGRMTAFQGCRKPLCGSQWKQFEHHCCSSGCPCGGYPDGIFLPHQSQWWLVEVVMDETVK